MLRRFSLRPSGGDGLGLVLLLLLVVLVPSVCLLWFMNQAVQNERLAVHQKLVDAYRGHLTLAQERLDSHWRQTGSDLDTEAEKLSALELFARQVGSGLADAVICFDSVGNVVYPDVLSTPGREPMDSGWTKAQSLEAAEPAAAAEAFAGLARQATNTDYAARALQAQARCLIRSGKKEAALSVLTGPLADERYRGAKDLQGTLIVPNAGLMALELMKESAPGLARNQLERLKSELLDYHDEIMAASQRRFLMHEVQNLFPNRTSFPMLAAEDLAARYIEAGSVHPVEPAFRATSLPGVWQFGSKLGRAVTLHQIENLRARMRAAIASQNLPADVRVDFLAPGQEAEGSLLSLPAGPTLQGWRLALSLKDQRLFDAATDQRIASYVWIGVLVVSAVAILASLAFGMMRRQIALTQLRNDLVANVTHELKTPLSSMRLLVDTLLNSETVHEQTAREYLQLIAGENLRLSRLIDNFLTFSRLERNKYTFAFKEIPGAAIVQGASEAMRERFSAPGCRFEVEAPLQLPSVVADADAMVTALVNLLDNAWKYSGEEKLITLAAGARNGSVFFTVKDNGIGLSPRDTKRIFKRFYQVDQRLSRNGGGCGLGLSIVKFIVTAHRGTVQVESEPGRGSSFTIAIPRAEARPDQTKPSTNPGKPGGLT